MITGACLFLVVMMGVIDRLRGDEKDIVNKGVEQIIYGLAVTSLVALQSEVYDWRALVGITVLFALGLSFGWGRPVGEIQDLNFPRDPDKYEWWQFGIFKKPWPALFLRGAMIGLPCLLVYRYNPAVTNIVIAYMIAMPAALFISIRAPVRVYFPYKWFPVWNREELNEAIRPWIAGTLLMVMI